MTHDGAYLIVIPLARWHVAANDPYLIVIPFARWHVAANDPR